jgi:hypothetical protein
MKVQTTTPPTVDLNIEIITFHEIDQTLLLFRLSGI